MSFRNAGCRVAATCVVLVLGPGAVGQDRPETEGAPPAREPGAQPGGDGPEKRPEAPDPADPPEPRQAIAAFNLVQGWIRDGEVPEPPDGRAIPRASGASVVLRQDGEVVGRGTDFSEDGLAVWRAARAAWAEASGRLRVERDALAEVSLKQAAAGLTISLELAGAPVPMLGGDYGDMSAEIDPGLTGLGVRAGERVSAMFPAVMLATGTMPDEAIGVVLLDLFGGDQSRVMDDRLALLPARVLREREGVAFLKFRVSHIAHGPDGLPAFLHRGGRVVGVGAINVAALREMGAGMARHLAGRVWPGDDGYGMFGRLNPATGKFDPRFADAAEQATAVLALRRFSTTPGVDRIAAMQAAAFASELLSALARVERDERAAWDDPASAAMGVVAFLEGGRPGSAEEVGVAGLFSRCASAVTGAYEPGTGFAPSVAPGARGLVAWALVRLAADSGGEAMRSRAEGAVRAVYAGTPPEMLVGQMPWLGWAERELAGGGEIAAAVALRDMRELVWKHQLGSADLAPEDADFAGGIVFTKSRSPLPAWNTARPLAWLATMLGDERLTAPQERPGELVRVVEGLRFIRQLTVDDSVTFMFKGPAGRTLGGVRAAPWDIRMPPDATSLSLLAVCEALRSLDGMQRSTGER